MMEDGNIKHKNYCLSVEKAKSGATVVLKDCDQAGWIQVCVIVVLQHS